MALIKALMLLISLLIVGCMPSQFSRAYAPQSAVIFLPLVPDAAYRQATKAAALMGGEIALIPGQPHMLQARIHGAVILVVMIEKQGVGSQVTVNGSIMSGKMVSGEFTEVQDYVNLLKGSQI